MIFLDFSLNHSKSLLKVTLHDTLMFYALLDNSKAGRWSIYNVVTGTFLQFLSPYSLCLLYNSEIKWTPNVPKREQTTGWGISCIAPMWFCLASNLHKSPIAGHLKQTPELSCTVYSTASVHCTGQLYNKPIKPHSAPGALLGPWQGPDSSVLFLNLFTSQWKPYLSLPSLTASYEYLNSKK